MKSHSHYEIQAGNLLISTNPKRLQIETINKFLSKAYWASDRPREIIRRSLQKSLCFGIYSDSAQVGFARVVTDFATFAWLCDVFIESSYRGRGLGKALISAILKHPDLKTIKRWMLATKDAHEFYRPFGFKELMKPDNFMEHIIPDSYLTRTNNHLE